MRQTIWLAVLLFVRVTAVASEVPVSSIDYGPPDGTATVAALASSGDVALLVWNEVRAGDGSSRSRIVAARIDASGASLDRVPFRISSSDEGFAVAAAWTGSVFLVAWNTSDAAHLTTVDVDGHVGRTVELGSRWAAALSCHAQACLVTLSGGLPWARTLDTIVTDAEGVVRVPRQAVAQLPNDVTAILSATDGSSHLVAWSTFDPNGHPREVVRYASIGDDGRLRYEFKGPDEVRPAAIASDGTGYVLALWHGSGLVWQPLTADGDNAGRSVRPHTASLSIWSRVAIMPSGGNFLVVGGDVALVLDEYGSPITQPASTSNLVMLAAAPLHGRTLVVSRDTATANLVVWQLRSDASPIGDLVPVHVAARPQSAPAAALAGDRLLTVWTEQVDGRSQVRMSVLRGAVTREVEQWVAPSTARQQFPSLVFNGSEYLVLWTESGSQSEIMGRRFTSAGVPLDAAAVKLTDPATAFLESPFAASDGRDFVVTWTEYVEGRAGPRVVAARWSTAGAFAKVEVSPAEAGTRVEGIAWDGSQYVVLWSVARPVPILCTPGCWTVDLRATIMSRAGEVAVPAGISIADVARDDRPQIVSTSEGSLVTWIEYSPRGGTIVGRLLRRDGTMGASRILASGKEFILASSIARVASQLFLAWTTFGKVRGAFVSPDGSSAGQPVKLADAGAAGGDRPVVVDLGGGEIAVVFQRLTDDSEHGTAARLFVRTVTVSAPRQRSIRR